MELRELKGLLRAKGYTYARLASEIGIGLNTVSFKLNGQAPITSNDVRKISALLDINREDIPKYFFPESK